jgi:hypothetical protein
MRTIFTGFLVVLFASLATGQDRDRIFYLTHTDTIQQFQEVATVIRTIADVKQIAADNVQKSVTVHASPDQIAMAEWLFNELDSPTPQASAPHEFSLPGSADDVVRVFYVTTAATVQDFQEVSTLVRTISDTRRVFTYNARKALVLRGTAAQVALAEWLVKELEPKTSPSSREYGMPGGNDDVVGVLYLSHTGSTQNFQKAATQIRTETQIKRVFTYNALKAVAWRGTASQIALAESLAKDLDKP